MEASMFTKRLAARRVQIFSDFTIKVQNTKKIYINQTIEYDKQMRILNIWETVGAKRLCNFWGFEAVSSVFSSVTP